MTDDPCGPAMIDALRSVKLTNGFTAAVLIDADGTECLVCVDPHGIGITAVFDPTCATVRHEQLGRLGLDTKRRIALAQRQKPPDEPTGKETPK